MGKASQGKGKRAEVEACRLLDAVRGGYDHDALRSRKFPGWHVEVKHVEKLNIWQALLQALRDAHKYGEDKEFVLFRRNRSDWYVALRYDLFEEVAGHDYDPRPVDADGTG